MELFKEILAHTLAYCERKLTVENPDFDLTKIVENESYQALQKNKAIIEDDTLEDAECFMKIEEIVQTLEQIGSDGGTRHDFG